MKSITLRTLLALAIMLGAILYTGSTSAEIFGDNSEGSGAEVAPVLGLVR